MNNQLTQQKPRHKRDLSHINNLSELQSEIAVVKASLRVKEADLQQRWKEVPKETFKATVNAVVPFAVNQTLLNKSFNIVSSAASMLFRNTDKHDAADTIKSSAKKIGLATVVKLAFSALKKKK